MTDILRETLINLQTPAILFFILGFFVALLRTDLKIPDPIIKMLSFYLLTSIGFKGGYELSKNGFGNEILIALLVSLIISAIIPVVAFFILNKFLKIDSLNSGALAAHYGSVSVVTFVTAAALLTRNKIEYDGFMVGMMTVMEFPAIIFGIGMAIFFSNRNIKEFKFSKIVRESFTNESVILLAGSLLTGILTGEKGYLMIKPFFFEPFQGVLTFFLLDLGIVAGKRFGEFKALGVKLISFALLFPLFSGLITAFITVNFGISPGNSILFSVLAASSSYIAAPAAVRIVLPDANPSYYITTSLAITFPFNIIIGIPVYKSFVDLFYGFM